MKGAEPLVLVVDDAAATRRLMRRVLERHGFRIIEAATGEEALAAVVEARPDIVVLDLDGGSAHQLGRLVSGASPDTTVVLWAREEDFMEVIDPVSADSRRVSAPVLERLRSELSSSNVQRVEE